MYLGPRTDSQEGNAFITLLYILNVNQYLKMSTIKSDSLQYESVQLKRKSLPPNTKVKPILVTTKRKTVIPGLTIIEGNKDVTPKPLEPELFTAGRERQISVYDISGEKQVQLGGSISSQQPEFRTQSTVRFRAPESERFTQLESTMHKTSASCFSVDLSYLSIDPLISDTMAAEKGGGSTPSESEETVGLFETEEEDSDILSQIQYPEHVSLVLRETDTHFLLDIPSVTAEKDTDEGNFIGLVTNEGSLEVFEEKIK